MNIFWLDLRPKVSAALACDQHIIKMLSEHTQQLLTVLEQLGFSDLSMKSTHSKHPCVKWVASEFANFVYLYQLNNAYFVEYLARYPDRSSHLGFYKMEHDVFYVGWPSIRKAYQDLGQDNSSASLRELFERPWLFITVPPQALPNPLRVVGSREQQLATVVKAYRRNYQTHKSKFARYLHSEVPVFMRKFV